MKERVVIIPAKAVSHLKKKAKVLQRQTGQPHHEALETVAGDVGLNSWHEVTLAAADTVEREKLFKRGVYVLMDVKEGQDSAGGDFVEADEPLLFHEQEIVDWLRADDEDHRAASVEETREFISDNYICLRYIGPSTTRLRAVGVMEELLHWMPQLIWWKGKLIDPIADYKEDDDEDDGPAEPMPILDEAVLRAALGNGAGLVVNSLDTMERYKAFEGPQKAWNWCLHCERAYPLGSYRQVRNLQMCPYAGCGGDAVIDLWPWVQVLRSNPGYPSVPELATDYPLYGHTSR